MHYYQAFSLGVFSPARSGIRVRQAGRQAGRQIYICDHMLDISYIYHVIAYHMIACSGMCSGSGSSLFAPFYPENDHLAKTGSGQT
jgi:hypothetical protein